jgi:cytochrome P450
MKRRPHDGPTFLASLALLVQLRRHDLLHVSESVARRYGKFVHIRLFHKHLFFASDPFAIAHILEDRDRVYDKIDTRSTIHHIAGDSLNTLRRDQDWERKQALFDRHVTTDDRTERITERALRSTFDRWDAAVTSGTTIDAGIDLLALSTSIASENFFHQSVEDVDFVALDHHKYTVVAAMLRRQFSLIRLPLWTSPRLVRAFRFRDGLVRRVLDRHLALRQRPESYVDDLVQRDGIRRADRRAVALLRGEILSALYLASDPFDKLLSKALYFLAWHPDEARTIREEAQGLAEGVGLTLHSASSLHAVRRFLLEVLRLKTPYAVIGREALAEHRLGDRRIPKGSLFAIMPLVVHKDPDFWERPSEFDPARFEGIAVGRAAQFIPFSAGERQCPGQGFALRQAMYVLARIVLAYDIRPVEGFDYSDRFVGVLSSKHHYRFRVSRVTAAQQPR